MFSVEKKFTMRRMRNPGRTRYLSVRSFRGRKRRWLAFFGLNREGTCVATTNTPFRLA
jgi:hypothetical protein